jgi:glyoxylase-like metal-dependent hydrolase (beta-lactamase superfamily II)
MSISPIITRRSALLSAAAAPLAASVLATRPAMAAGNSADKSNAPFAHFKVGDFVVTTLLAGSTPRGEPQTIFGMNVSEEEFAAVSEENFISTESARFYFTPTVVNTGSDLVLFDTGLPGQDGGTPGVVSALEAAGYDAKDVTRLVITHMHPDHIGGFMTGPNPTFPNAAIYTGQVEYDFWSKQDGEQGPAAMVRNMITPMAEKITFVKGDDTIVSGITAVEAFGHTPGHMAYMLESGGQQLLLIADTANHYVWSLAYPEWEVRFDADKAAAAATRKKLIGMAAADKIPFVGYHMPFPAVGYAAVRDGGFRYVPESYQLAL